MAFSLNLYCMKGTVFPLFLSSILTQNPELFKVTK